MIVVPDDDDDARKSGIPDDVLQIATQEHPVIDGKTMFIRATLWERLKLEFAGHWNLHYGYSMTDALDLIAGISAKRRPEWDAFAPGPVPNLELLDAGWWMEYHGCGVRISADYVGTTEPYTDHYGYEDWALEREYGPDLTLPVMEPYEPKPGRIWCNKACHDDDMAERSRIKRMERKAKAIVEAWALKKYPGIEIVRGQEGYNRTHHTYVNRDLDYLLIRDVRVPITFPGAKYGNMVVVNDDDWRKSYIIDGRPWTPRDGYTCQTTANRAPLSMRKRVLELWIANGDKDAWDAWNATRDGRYPDEHNQMAQDVRGKPAIPAPSK